MPDYFVLCEACGQVNRATNPAVGTSIRCKSCNRPIRLTEENTVPVDRDAPSDVEIVYGEDDTMHAASPSDDKQCARCGRAFRGDWDRYPRPEGVICHICANQNREPDPEFMQPTEPVENTLPFEGFESPSPPESEPKPQTQFEQTMQKVAIVGAVIVVGFAILFTIVDPQPDVADPGSSSDPASAEEMAAANLPQFVYVLAIALEFVAGIVPHFIALYLLLSWTNNLPNDTLWKNIIALSVVTIAVAALNIVPCVGFILGLLFVSYMYQLDWRECIMYLILSALAAILVWIANQAILGVLVGIFA